MVSLTAARGASMGPEPSDLPGPGLKEGVGGLGTFRLTGRSNARVKTGGTEQAPYSVVLGMAHSAAICPLESERLSLAIYILVGGRKAPPPSSIKKA